MPTARDREREDALAELTRRYFTSHGPATLRDFTWWSGLTMADAKAGVDMAKEHLIREVIGENAYWMPVPAAAADVPSPAAYLLPAYDEYTVAYADRSAILDPAYAMQEHSREGILNPVLVVDGQVVGTWKRTLAKDGVEIALQPFGTLGDRESGVIATAAARYGEFLGRSAIVS